VSLGIEAHAAELEHREAAPVAVGLQPRPGIL
jgi:hypothetical protein